MRGKAAEGVQVESLCEGDHPVGITVVRSISDLLPAAGRDDERARGLGRSLDAQPLGHQVRAGI